MAWGALVGLCCESVYQSWLLYQQYHQIEVVVLFWVPVAVVLGLMLGLHFDDRIGQPIGRFLFPVLILAVFVSYGAMSRTIDHISSVLAPTGGALIGSALNGGVLGMTLVGGVFGFRILLRREHLHIVPDARPESIRRFRAFTIALLVAFGVLTVTYIKWPAT